MALTLYHCADARSFRALWALEELGLAYELKLLPFPPRVLAPEYLAENPLGTIPLLVDGATRMTESAAIAQYLATRDGPTALSVEPGDPAYGAWLNGLHFGEATLTFPQTLVLRYTRLEPRERRNPQVADDYGRWFNARLKGLSPRLDEGGGWYCAGCANLPALPMPCARGATLPKMTYSTARPMNWRSLMTTCVAWPMRSRRGMTG